MANPARLLALSLATATLLASTAAASGTRPHVFRTSGIVVRYPVGWHVSTEPLTGITDPVQRFVLSSYRIPAGFSSTGDYYAPRIDGVVVQVDEEVPPLGANDNPWPPRPRHFSLPRLGRMEGFAGKRWGERIFQQHGRRFYLFIGIGRHATRAQIRTLLTTLDRTRINARR
jgi:hypothetical protein